MNQSYPVEKASTMPGTCNEFYRFLLKNIATPAIMSHDMWYVGVKEHYDQCELRVKNDFRGTCDIQ